MLTVKASVSRRFVPAQRPSASTARTISAGIVTVQIRSRKAIWIEDLIALVESSASSELYSLLKRQDEKAVTERAYENPVFVEDLVRNVALKLNAHPDVTVVQGGGGEFREHPQSQRLRLHRERLKTAARLQCPIGKIEKKCPLKALGTVAFSKATL